MIFKVTLVLSAAAAIAFALRRSSASARHLVWMLGLALSLAIPVAAWLMPPVAMPGGLLFAVDGAARAMPSLPQSIPPLRWIWLAGALLAAVRFASGHVAAHRMVRTARPAGTRDGLAVRTSPPGSMPFTWGFLRPSVVMPEDAPDAIWLHERAHALRRDHWWLLVAQASCAVWWFHPLAWLAARRAELEREKACDDAALALGEAPADYARILVEAARTRLAPPASVMAIAGQSPLESRVRALLDDSIDRRGVSRRFIAAAAAVTLAIGLPILAQQPKVYKVGEDGTTAPRLKRKVEPAYTEEARDAQISGKVVLRIEIHEDGKAHDIAVIEPLDAGLDANAVKAVQEWEFEPATKDGNPVRVAATIEVNFRLQ